MRKLTQEEVIKRFVAKHGDRYDYSLVEYVDSKTKVKIICPVHGVFEQSPNEHLKSRGCFQCFGSIKYTNETFAEAANKKHNFKYNYSKVCYEDQHKKVNIICKDHGEFLQTPNSHLCGNGCPRCGKNKAKDKLAYTKEEFVEKSKLRHGDKYDYSLVEYNNTMCKVKIVCPVHGVFEQFAGHHLKGHGCQACSSIERGLDYRKDFQSFVDKADALHNHKYTYHADTYTKRNRKTKITCPIHGDFWQSPAHHMRSTGCPDCSKTGFSKDKDAWLYIINTKEFIGFGITRNLKTRMSIHKKNLNAAGIEHRLFGTVRHSGQVIYDIERHIKQRFKQHLVNTGIEGFKWEAVKPEVFADLLNFIERYNLKENRPGGRYAE